MLNDCYVLLSSCGQKFNRGFIELEKEEIVQMFVQRLPQNLVELVYHHFM
jgi:hypothetical protein